MYNSMSPMEIAFEFLDIAFVLAQGFLLSYFFGSFLELRGKGRYMGLYVAAVYGLMRKSLDYWLPFSYEGLRAVGKQALHLVLLAMLIFCFYRAFQSLTVFLIMAFQAVRDISVYLAVILLDKPGNMAFALWEWKGWERIFTSPFTWSLAVNLTTGALQVFRILLILLLMRLSLKRIVTDFREKQVRMAQEEVLFILLPALTGFMLCSLLRVIMVTVEQDVAVFLYQKYPPLAVLLPVVLLLSLQSILQGVRTFQKIQILNNEKNSRMILEKQVENMQEYMRERERIYSGVQSVKHDMKNTLAVISSLAGGQEPEAGGELQAYLSALNQTMDQLEIAFHTGNQVVDALLHRKSREVLETLPDLRLDAEELRFPSSLGIRSYDLGILLGNALDNALEACIKLKKLEPEAEVFIRLISFQRGNLLFLRVENSFDGTIIRKSGEDFPKTDKRDKELHGMGLPNMKRVAESYQGTVDWNLAGRVFTLAVMLKCPSSDRERRV